MSIISDVEQAAREMGIEGYDELGAVDDIYSDPELAGYDEIGAKRALKKAGGVIKQMQKMIRVGSAHDRPGPKRTLPMACVAVLPLAAAGVGNLTWTPNRRVTIIDAVIEMYGLAAVVPVLQPAAVHITNITVEGRTLWPAAGVLPIASFSRDAANRRPGNELFLDLGECQSTQNIVFACVNNDAATACVLVGTLWVICTP